MADNAVVYNIEFSDPLKTGIIILPGTTDVSTSLTLSGNGNLKWGEDFNESLLHVMEHFSSGTKPANGVEGQIWFNSSAQDLYLFAGVGSPVWSPLGIGPGAVVTPYVKKVGDTMTGNLVIEKTSPRLFLNSTDNTDSRLDFQENGITVGDLGFAAGSNDITLQRRAGAGSPPTVSESIALISGAGQINVPFKLLAGDPVAPEDATRKQYVDDAVAAGASTAVPAGTIVMFGGSTAPTGYLICDGEPRSRTTYADLFAAIGTNYGVGDGSTTFETPDLRGRFAVGDRRGTVDELLVRVLSKSTSLGSWAGSEFVTLTSTEVPNHTHGASSNNRGGHDHSGTTNTKGSHTHGIFGHFAGDVEGGGSDREVRPGGTTDSAGSHSHSLNISSEPSHSHTITVNTTTGGGNSHENTPPFMAVNYIIKY